MLVCYQLDVQKFQNSLILKKSSVIKVQYYHEVQQQPFPITFNAFQGNSTSCIGIQNNEYYRIINII